MVVVLPYLELLVMIRVSYTIRVAKTGHSVKILIWKLVKYSRATMLKFYLQVV